VNSAAEALSYVAALDDLYRRVAAQPSDWTEREFAAWLEDLAGQYPEGIDRATARWIRRAVRQAAKLARYWSARPAAERPGDWRSAVDEALGSPGWAPSLEVARSGLEQHPDSELFDLVAARFRVVQFRPWLDGIGYEEWLASRPSP
jgi:hypothetical protein